MKRSDFFTRLVLGFVAIWKAPEILAKKHVGKSPQPYLDRFKEIVVTSGRQSTGIKYSNKWFEDNYSWLRKWVENYRVQSWKKRGRHVSNYEYFDGMQRFLSPPYSSDDKLGLDKRYEEHVIDIIRAAVFSRKLVMVNDGQRLDHMSGFVEQMGRLPIKTDKVRFITCSDDARGSRFLRTQHGRRHGKDTITFLSDCRLEIVGVKPEQRKTWYSPKITEQGIELIPGLREAEWQEHLKKIFNKPNKRGFYVNN